MRSKDGLLAEKFCNKEIPGPNCTTTIRVRRFQSPTSLHMFQYVKMRHVFNFSKHASKTPANVLEPHGPSMYTLSMCVYQDRNIIITRVFIPMETLAINMI